MPKQRNMQMKKFMIGLIVGMCLMSLRVYVVQSRMSEIEEERDGACLLASENAARYFYVLNKYDRLKSSIETYATHK